MALTFHPKAGQILLCDFSEGFKEPEMVKKSRPVVVLTPPIRGREKLVTIIALSTKKPDVILPFHYQVPKNSMPQIGRFQQNDTWLKGDMIYTMGFHRLDLIRLGKPNPKTGKRAYFNNRLGRDQMRAIYTCVLHGLNLPRLIEHL